MSRCHKVISRYPSSQSERGAAGLEHTACRDLRTPGWNRQLKDWPDLPPSQPTSGKCWEFQIWWHSSGCKQYHTKRGRASSGESFSFSLKIQKSGKCCPISPAVQPRPVDKQIIKLLNHQVITHENVALSDQSERLNIQIEIHFRFSLQPWRGVSLQCLLTFKSKF